MNIHEHRFLLSERATLKKLISQADESDVIARMSFEARLQDVEEQLEAYEGFSPRSSNASLTFGGRPVVGRHGIAADFGAKALAAFEKAVASVGASQDGHLRWMGPIPNRDAYRLLITGVAQGSFGFQFESATQGNTITSQHSRAESAVETVTSILKASIEVENDYELADFIGSINQRAIKDVYEFLELVAKNGAVCTLEFGDDEMRFHDTEQVRRSAERLGRIEREEVVELIGQFIGFMPHQSRVGFVVDEPYEVITGMASGHVVEFAEENRRRPVRVTARRRQIGTARPHYTFLDILEW